jgi:hypothetical protein
MDKITFYCFDIDHLKIPSHRPRESSIENVLQIIVSKVPQWSLPTKCEEKKK